MYGGLKITKFETCSLFINEFKMSLNVTFDVNRYTEKVLYPLPTWARFVAVIAT